MRHPPGTWNRRHCARAFERLGCANYALECVRRACCAGLDVVVDVVVVAVSRSPFAFAVWEETCALGRNYFLLFHANKIYCCVCVSLHTFGRLDHAVCVSVECDARAKRASGDDDDVVVVVRPAHSLRACLSEILSRRNCAMYTAENRIIVEHAFFRLTRTVSYALAFVCVHLRLLWNIIGSFDWNRMCVCVWIVIHSGSEYRDVCALDSTAAILSWDTIVLLWLINRSPLAEWMECTWDVYFRRRSNYRDQ